MQDAREATAGLVKAGTDPLIDVVDDGTKAVGVALQETHTSVNATVGAVVRVEGKSFNAAMDESEALRQQYITSIRRIRDALVEVVR